LQEEFKDVVFDFVKNIVNIEEIIQIILFGSVAKEEADARSDIDFFIILDRKNKNIQKQIQDIAYKIEKDYDRNIQLTFSEESLKGFDESFLEDIFTNGMIIFSRKHSIKVKSLKLNPFVIFSFSLKNLTQSDKMKIKRALYGGKSYSKYKKKIYKTKVTGLLTEENKLGKGSLIIERNKSKTIEKIFRRFDLEYKKMEVWKSV